VSPVLRPGCADIRRSISGNLQPELKRIPTVRTLPPVKLLTYAKPKPVVRTPRLRAAFVRPGPFMRRHPEDSRSFCREGAYDHNGSALGDLTDDGRQGGVAPNVGECRCAGVPTPLVVLCVTWV
jgi:hypothetical protein